MFLFPIATDAPIYHPPIGTILLIVANIVCFQLTGWGDPDNVYVPYFEMTLGDGLHPKQWISCHFLHYGIFHLLGNMMFLYIYGLVIEGKVGTFVFLIMYFLIGWFGASAAQLVMLYYPSAINSAGGASIIVFGLMLVSLLWAPKNEVSFVGFYMLFFMPRPLAFELTMMSVGIWFVGMNLFDFWLYEFAFVSAMGHLVGAAFGFAVGMAMLKLQLVDCEGWDVLSLRKQDPTKKSLHYYRASYEGRDNEYDPEMSADPELHQAEKLQEKKEKWAHRYRRAVADENPGKAMKAFQKMSLLSCEDALTREDLEDGIELLLEYNDWHNAISQLEFFIDRFPDHSNRHRLKLAELMILKEKRPHEALNQLRQINAGELDQRLQERRKKLIHRAKKQIAG